MSLSMKRRLALPAAKMPREPMKMPESMHNAENRLPPNTRHRNGMRGKMK